MSERGRQPGFPRFRREGRDADRYRVTTGSFEVCDRRHVKLPRIGRVRIHENARRLHRLLGLDRARLLNVTVRRRGHRPLAVFTVEVVRPQCDMWDRPPSRVTWWVWTRASGVLRLWPARDGEVIERVENPRALDRSLARLRRLHRARSRCTPGSVRHRRRTAAISSLNARIANQRTNAIHVLTTRLAKTHDTVVVESLNVRFRDGTVWSLMQAVECDPAPEGRIKSCTSIPNRYHWELDHPDRDSSSWVINELALTEWFGRVGEYMPGVEDPFKIPELIVLGETFELAGSGYHEGDLVALTIESSDGSVRTLGEVALERGAYRWVGKTGETLPAGPVKVTMVVRDGNEVVWSATEHTTAVPR